MNNKINIVKADGSNVNVDIICYIENISTNARYVYYTLNEVMGTGASSTIKIYVSKERTNSPSDTPITDAEWNELKGYMADALKGNSNPNIKYLAIPTDIISISDKAIAMPVNYDYVNKQKGIYAESIATLEQNPISEPNAASPVSPIELETTSAPNVLGETAPANQNVTEAVINESASPYKEPDFSVPVEPSDSPIGPTTGINDMPSNRGIIESKVSSNLEKINIEEIEAKYAKMIDDINKLKENEIEAANRYNATLDLSQMHNEQHASYVASEQTKENAIPNMGPTPMTMVEPEPIVSSAPIGNSGMETNWFDMPQN